MIVWLSLHMRKIEHRDNTLITTAEAAELLGVTPSTVNRMAATGRLPQAAKANGIRGARMFYRSDVEALAKEPAA